MKNLSFFKISQRELYLILGIPPLFFIFVNCLLLGNWISGGFHFFQMVKVVYNFNTYYFPILCLIAGIVLLFYYFKKYPLFNMLFYGGMACIGTSILLIGLRIYATHIEPHNLQLKQLSLTSSKRVQPIRLLHISDTQSDRVGWYEERTFKRIRELNPDLVIHTGDFVQEIPPATFQSEISKLAELIGTVKPRLGFFGVYGDTDNQLHRLTTNGLGGCIMLEDESYVIKDGPNRLNLYGLSLYHSAKGNPEAIAQWLANCQEDDFTLLFGHRPDYLLHSEGFEIDLCLAGHTHGGQVVIPYIGPLTIASDVPFEWAKGYREVGNLRFNVSAGIGCEHLSGVPDLRFNCPPEMTLIEFTP